MDQHELDACVVLGNSNVFVGFYAGSDLTNGVDCTSFVHGFCKWTSPAQRRHLQAKLDYRSNVRRRKRWSELARLRRAGL